MRARGAASASRAVGRERQQQQRQRRLVLRVGGQAGGDGREQREARGEADGPQIGRRPQPGVQEAEQALDPPLAELAAAAQAGERNGRARRQQEARGKQEGGGG